jgi:hypothetical protein
MNGADAAQLMSADIYNRIGNSAYLKSDLATAEQNFLKAIEIEPENADAWGNLGLIWQQIGAFDDAFQCYNKALAINGDHVGTLVNLGYLTFECGHPENAIALYEKALRLQPDHPRATGNLAVAKLMVGDYAEGWALLEARFRTTPPVAIMREYPFPWWDGKPTGCLAVWPEQGVGDQILYSTLLPEVFGRGQRMVVEVDPRLLATYERSFPFEGVSFVPRGSGGSAMAYFEGCTAHIAMGSLPALFRPSALSFARQSGKLLLPDRARVATFRDLLPVGKKRVAISWRSFQPDINKLKGDTKSATLKVFAPLAQREDLALVDVQYGDTAMERGAFGHKLARPELDRLNDIDGVMALIQACDVVVTTSNVTAHFAGALGKETYLIYRRAHPPFFYHAPNERGRSRWYPSIQCVSGDDLTLWEEVIAKVNERI